MKTRKVYIASCLPNLGLARELARRIACDHVQIVSTWHLEGVDNTVETERKLDSIQQSQIAEQCFREIEESTHFVWLYSGLGERYGSAVEYGYAARDRKHLLCVSAPKTVEGFETVRSVPPSVFGHVGISLIWESAIQVLTAPIATTHTILQIVLYPQILACQSKLKQAL
jgi:hypothetical protein